MSTTRKQEKCRHEGNLEDGHKKSRLYEVATWVLLAHRHGGFPCFGRADWTLDASANRLSAPISLLFLCFPCRTLLTFVRPKLEAWSRPFPRLGLFLGKVENKEVVGWRIGSAEAICRGSRRQQGNNVNCSFGFEDG